MNIVFFGALLNTLGGTLIAYAALRVHHRVLNEHRIDGRVFRIMKYEQRLGVLGVFCLLCGFVLEHVVPLIS